LIGSGQHTRVASPTVSVVSKPRWADIAPLKAILVKATVSPLAAARLGEALNCAEEA
jgi:hypothetical protein